MRTSFADAEIELYPTTSDAAERETSLRLLKGLIYDFKYRHAEARRVVLEVHARLRGLDAGAPSFAFDTGSPRGDAVGEELLGAVRMGRLVLRPRTTRSVVVAIEAEPETVLGPEPEPTAWIEIDVVDDDGSPVEGQKYRIVCEDGRVRTGTTDARGKAREEGLRDGLCQVTLTGLRDPDWKKAG